VAALAFVSSLGNFGILAMLGIPPVTLFLPSLIYQQMAGISVDDMLRPTVGLGLSMIMPLFGVGGQWLLQQWFKQAT